jgi:hypothetical protein
MRSLVLGAFIFASFGLSASAAEPPSDKAASHARRPACHWVTADRTLRLLRDALPGERRIATERPVSRPVREPIAKVSRPVTPVRVVSRPAPVRVASRGEAIRLLSRVEPAARALAQHVSLVVGIGY